MGFIKPDGWRLEMMSASPEQLFRSGCELIPSLVVIFVGLVIAATAILGDPLIIAIPLALVWLAAGTTFLRWSWQRDQHGSKVLRRFLRYPAWIPAHASRIVPMRKRISVRERMRRSRMKR